MRDLIAQQQELQQKRDALKRKREEEAQVRDAEAKRAKGALATQDMVSSEVFMLIFMSPQGSRFSLQLTSAVAAAVGAMTTSLNAKLDRMQAQLDAAGPSTPRKKEEPIVM